MEIKKKIAAVLAAATTLMSTFGAMGVSAADATATELAVTVNMGDINKDGSVLVSDYVLLSNYLTGNGELTAEQAVIADMTRDGVLSIFDQILLGRTVCDERELEPVEEVTEPTEPTTEPATDAPTEPATEAGTDPTEPVTTAAPVTTTTTTVTTTADPSGKVNATIKESNGNYKFSFDEAIGEEVYLVIEADETVTFANGCVGIEATVDEVSYWVSYKWEADGSETVKVDLTTPYEITYNSGENKVTDEALIAKIAEAVMAKTSGEVQVWHANDAEGEKVANTLVTLADAYIIKEAPVTTTTVVVTTVVEVPTTVAPTTTEAVIVTTVVEVPTTAAPATTAAAVTTTETVETTAAVTTTEAVETTTVSTLAFPYEFKIDSTNTAAVAYVKFAITTDTAVNYNGAVQFFVEDVNTDVEFSSADAVDGVITVNVPETITNPSAIKLIKICKYWQSDEEATVALTEVKALVGGKEIDSYVQPEGEALPYSATLAEKDFDTLTFSVNPGETEWYGGAVQAYNGGTLLVEKEFSGNGTAQISIDFSEIDTTEITSIQILQYWGGNGSSAEGEVVKITVYDIEYVSATVSVGTEAITPSTKEEETE